MTLLKIDLAKAYISQKTRISTLKLKDISLYYWFAIKEGFPREFEGFELGRTAKDIYLKTKNGSKEGWFPLIYVNVISDSLFSDISKADVTRDVRATTSGSSVNIKSDAVDGDIQEIEATDSCRGYEPDPDIFPI